MDLSFLERIRVARLLLEFRATTPLELPLLSGSALRGILFRRLYAGLCLLPKPCPGTCANPGHCPARPFGPNHGDGASQPLLILDPPVPPEFESAASGGEVAFPFHLSPPLFRGEEPCIEDLAPMSLEPGTVFPVGLTVGESLVRSLPAMIHALASAPLVRAQSRGAFELERVRDLADAGRILFTARHSTRQQGAPVQPPLLLSPAAGVWTRPRTVRVLCLTPWRFRIGDDYCFRMRDAARHFPQACYARAVRILSALEGGTQNAPAVWKPERVEVEQWHGYRYRWQRRRQDDSESQQLDGLCGFFDLTGGLEDLAPLLRTAELLHVGQKSGYGLGRVDIRLLE
jgi:hypothetical protein